MPTNGRPEWGREQSICEEIVSIGRLMYDHGYAVANDGNISVRLDAERVVCTPSGLCKGMMCADQMIIVNMEGRKVGMVTAANRELVPTSEMFMHLEIYRQRPDVQAVVHAHPPTTIALSIAGVSLADCMLPEVIVKLGLVPTAPYSTPASPEMVTAIRDLVVNHDGIILERHGTVTVGGTLLDAYMRMETLEQIAKITVVLEQLGKGQPLPPEQVAKLMAQRRKMGLTHAGEEEEFCQVCGVCPTPGAASQAGSSGGGEFLPDSQADLVRVVTEAVLRELGYSS